MLTPVNLSFTRAHTWLLHCKVQLLPSGVLTIAITGLCHHLADVLILPNLPHCHIDQFIYNTQNIES